MKRYYHATGYFHNSSTSGATVASLISSGLVVVWENICFSISCSALARTSNVSCGDARELFRPSAR